MTDNQRLTIDPFGDDELDRLAARMISRALDIRIRTVNEGGSRFFALETTNEPAARRNRQWLPARQYISKRQAEDFLAAQQTPKRP